MIKDFILLLSPMYQQSKNCEKSNLIDNFNVTIHPLFSSPLIGKNKMLYGKNEENSKNMIKSPMK